MCDSHNARMPDAVTPGPHCSECVKQLAAEAEAATQAKVDAHAEGWRRIRAAAEALVAAGSPGLETRDVVVGYRDRLLRKPQPEHATLGPGWPVGVCTWSYTVKNPGTPPFTSTAELETAVSERGELIPIGRSDGVKPQWVSAPRPAEIADRIERIAKSLGVAV
jgi:hypothetical protein